MNRNDHLFSSTDWFSVSDARKKAIRDEINELDPNQLLNTSVETAVQYFIDKTAIEIPVLDRDDLVIEDREVSRVVNDYGRQITVTATEIVVTVPFSGAADAWDGYEQSASETEEERAGAYAHGPSFGSGMSM